MAADDPAGSGPATLTVLVRPRAPAPGPEHLEALSSLPVEERHYPSREEYAAVQGADPADLAAVASFARAHGLDVQESDAAQRRVVLSGSAAALANAFGIAPGPRNSGAVPVPATLQPVVEAVFGLDDRPYARPHGA